MVAESTESVAAIVNKVDFFVNVLGVFSTILLGVFTILAAILGFLVWKNEEMKKKAQQELAKIEGWALKTEDNYEQLSLLLEVAQAEMTSVVNKNAELDKLLGSAATRTKEIADVKDAVGKYRQEIESSMKSLATISENIPTLSPSLSPSVSSSGPTLPSFSPSYRYSDLRSKAMQARLDFLRNATEHTNEVPPTD
jgi:hypothetical protein